MTSPPDDPDEGSAGPQEPERTDDERADDEDDVRAVDYDEMGAGD